MVSRGQVIEYMQLDAYRPMTVEELTEAFGIEDAESFKAFVRLLNDMEAKGEVVRTRTNRYGVPERMNLVVGRLQMKARGYGFLIPDAAGEPDVYIPADELGGAMSGDRVMARVEKVSAGTRREGKIIRVLERANHRVVGKVTKYRNHAFVTPLDKRMGQDIFIPGDRVLGAHDGDVVVVEITEFPTATRGPVGQVVEVLGQPDAPGIDILAVIRKYNLPEAFPEEVLAEAERIPLELSEEDYAGRRDLRSEVIVTIDGEDAKDLDDAVQVKRLDNGNYLLGVHIADVSYYVREGTRLDQEAYRRGTSVYLVDRVIPMLPPRLSNNVCSLNPKVDRLTLSCVMEITPAGEIVRHDIFPSVIRTTERMTYTAVNRILVHHDPEMMARYEALVPHFRQMEELALILRRRRMDRGAIDFDFEEVKVVVDDLGHPTDIVPRERGIAERIIEEFMLAANETVAEHFHWLGVPFVFRIHEEPELEKMLEFNEFIHNFGYHVKGLGSRIHPRALQEVLDKCRGTREERVIATLMLRSMRQARYSPEPVGHFGLAAQYYTHFTSPIRRYPDLVVHRIIRDVLVGRMHGAREERMREFVADAAAHSSIRERVAQDAERETDQLKMVEYMLDHVGEEFDGLISGVTQFGLFVQLTNGVEGLIHISYLTDDYYVLNEKQMALVGERARRVFRLGDPVRVRVTGANKEELTVDFELVAHHREGTLVIDDGVESVVYDEDLPPRERRRAVAERAAKARRPRGARGARDMRGAWGTRGTWTSESDADDAFDGRRRRAAGSDGSAGSDGLAAEAWTESGAGGSRKQRGRRRARAEVDFAGAIAPHGRGRNGGTGSRRNAKAAKAAKAAKGVRGAKGGKGAKGVGASEGAGTGGSKRGRKVRGMELAPTSDPDRVHWSDPPH